MAEASIPVDLFNPGQVFACLGFLEAADMLLGDAEGGFDWGDAGNVKFHLSAAGTDNPFAVVLEFLAQARPERWGPIGYVETGQDVENTSDDGDTPDDVAPYNGSAPLNLSDTFPASKGERMELPIRLKRGSYPVIELSHWADGSGREAFKLYSGNRSADGIAKAMLQGTRRKPKKIKPSAT